ncbi:MAG TPA: ABC transporter permease, partial [Rhodanobacteraceae bacterium]|nr:ABC transporter permease [Rhodanobacteraceae bacterium]
TFESVALWSPSTATVTGAGEPEEVLAVRASVEFLPTLRVEPLLGRHFTAADDTPGNPPTVMLSHGYWQRRFGAARDVVGRTLTLDGAPAEIVGVLPPGFRFLEEQADVLTPAQPDRARSIAGPIGERVIARLADGATLADARTDVARMIPIVFDTFPAPGAVRRMVEDNPILASLRPLQDRVVGELDDVLLVLMSTIGMLLLIACANIANLLLVRTEARRQELAIRAALGAGWAAIARSLLFESVVLALLGGAAGLLLASLTLPALLRIAGRELPSALVIGIDGHVVSFALGVSMLCGALLCLIPIAKHAAPRVVDALRSTARSYSAGRETHRARNTLVVAQVALALVLLIASGLMIRSFVALRSVEPGIYDPARVQTLRIVFPRPQTPDFLSMQQEVVERIAAVPGVEAVAYSTRRPLLASGPSGPFAFDNEPEEPVETEFRLNSPGYFTALGAPLLAGRDFEWTDIRESRAVTIVSANIANARWGDPAAALGHTLSRGGPGATPLTIVGVVGDIRHDGVDRRAPETVYLTQSEFGARFLTRSPFFFVRSGRVGTPGFVDEIRRAVWAVNSDLPFGAVEPLSAVYEGSMARTSLTLVLLAITSGMALLLGLVGLYAVIAYILAQRTREIGIRMALGAQMGALKSMLLRQVLALVAVGVALGVGGAAALTRFMESLLFGVTALDAATYVSVSAALFAIALVAGYLPARRVTRIDPMQSLRAE